MTGLTIRRLTSLKYKLFVTSVAVFALVAQPLYGVLSAQVANAEAAGLISSVDASYVKDSNPDYTGIYVGFDVENVTSAQSVELRVNRTNGEVPYSIFARSSVIDNINTKSSTAKYGTGGTVIVTGSRTSSSWTPQAGTWAGSSKPVSVDVIVTLQDNTELKSSDLTIRDNGATIDQVMPLPPADTTAPVVTSISQAYEEKEGGRIAVTLSFDEALNPSSLGQGWSEITGSNKTQFIKRYYVTKEHTVTFNDLANNQGSYTFTVDKTAPTVLQATQAFENHESGPRVNITLTFSEGINPISLPQGWYEVAGSNKTKYVKAFYSTKTHIVNFTDLTGNAGIFTLSVDATAPVAPILSLETAQGAVLATGGFTNKSDVVATWTKPAGDIAKYEYAYWNNIPSSQYNAENKAWTTDVAGITRSGAFDQGEGKHYMKVRAYSPSGNTSNWSNVFEVTYDKTLPANFAIKLADGRNAQDTTIGSEQTFTFTQTEANPKSIYIEYMEKDSNGNWTKKLGKEILGTNAAALTVNTSTWGEGVHQAKVTTRDKAGNEASNTAQFTVDNTPPSIIVKDGFKGNKSERVFREVSFSLSDAYMLDKYVINEHVSDFTNNKWSDANFQNIKQYLVQGENTLTLYDVAGNENTYTFTFDTQVPVAVFTHSNNNDNNLVNTDVTSILTSSEPIQTPAGWTPVTTTTFTKISATNNKGWMTITDFAGNSRSVFFEVKRIDKTNPNFNIADGSNFMTPSVEVVVNEENINKITVNGVAASYSGTKPDYKVIIIGEGTYTVIATDKAGNESTVAFTIDTPPTAPTISSFTANGISGTGEPGSIIGLAFGSTPVVTSLPITVGENGNWSYAFSPVLVAGSYNVSAIAIDNGGSSSSVTRSLTVSPSPSIPVTPAGVTQGVNGTNQDAGSSTPISTLLPATSLFSAAAPLLAPGTTPAAAAATDGDDTIASVQGLSTTNSNESADSEGEVKAAEDTKASWSLGNLALTAIAVIAGLMALLGIFRKRETDGVTHTALRAVVIVLAAGTAIAFVLTNDFAAPMTWFSMWSIAYAAAVIAQISIIANLKGSAE